MLTADLHRLLERGDVVVCGPVLAEIAAGARPADRHAVLATLAALPWADLDRRARPSVGLLDFSRVAEMLDGLDARVEPAGS